MEHYTIRNIARELDVSPEYLQVLIVRKTINIRQVDGKNSLYVASDLEINLLKKILKNYENMGDRKVFKMLDDAEMVGIGFEHDGESFNHDTPGECADWLKELSEMGYNVPQYAIDSLREDDPAAHLK